MALATSKEIVKHELQLIFLTYRESKERARLERIDNISMTLTANCLVYYILDGSNGGVGELVNVGLQQIAS